MKKGSIKIHKKDKSPKKTEENKLRVYFVQLFGKYDIRNEARFVYFCKWLIFALLLIVEAFVLLDAIEHWIAQGEWRPFVHIAALTMVLTASEGMKLFAVKGGGVRTIFYVIDAVAASLIIFFTDGVYPILVYVLILTELYMSTDRTRTAVAILGCSVLLYLGSYVVKTFILRGDGFELYPVLTETIGAVFFLVAHFVLVNVALAFYRQFLRLDKALKELDESKQELEKAYEVVAEVTALEERQRIAKEIHDTAGHSITTVIMQTEAAKLILESNPDEAKSKIVSANLQAKHALEELRDSVHLLSGISGNKTLKTALEEVIQESTDGTGIKIRSEIEDVSVTEEKYRFLCNTLKEGISNGLRHGGATAFWFELKKEDDNILFLLSDNGKGLSGKLLQMGFGLTTMQDRVKSLGGKCWFESEEEEGFEIHLTLPMSELK